MNTYTSSIILENKITLIGEVIGTPKLKFSKDKVSQYYTFKMSMPRKNPKYIDILPIVLSTNDSSAIIPREGGFYKIEGEIKKIMQFENGKNHLHIYVLGKEILEEYGSVDISMYETNNLAHLVGITKRLDEFRLTPLGKKIRDIKIACNNDYIPCIAWGDIARYAELHFKRNEIVGITGRLQSREYGENKITYELSISRIDEEFYYKYQDDYIE